MNFEFMRRLLDGAVGAGFVLVVLPCMVLVWGIAPMATTPTVGLPILAIFGIMILFGALALIAALFKGLDLTDPTQPLGLPEGSIRAAIALSLIVLFAIISIMLYQSLSKPVPITGISAETRDAMIKERANQIVAVEPECPKDASGKVDACTAVSTYTVYLVQPQGRESTDLAKQLLILIGTLMTSVTSFYFASRGNDVLLRDGKGAGTTNGDGTATDQPGETGDADDTESAVDGCNVAIDKPTADEDLPAAHGGVEAQ